MNYAILRLEKIKAPEMKKVWEHLLRTNPATTPHVDLSKRNEILINTPLEQVIEQVKRLARRKDAVAGFSILLAFSPEKLSEFKTETEKERWLDSWKTENLRWLEGKFGKDNIRLAVVHRDEQTPHLHVFTTVINENKLQAKHWIDGPADLKKMQDEYAKEMAQVGLERGIRNSKAKHVEVKDFYNAIKKPLPKLTEIKKVDTIFGLKQKEETATEWLNRNLPALRTIMKQARAHELAVKRKQELERTLKVQERQMEKQKQRITELEEENNKWTQEWKMEREEREKIQQQVASKLGTGVVFTTEYWLWQEGREKGEGLFSYLRELGMDLSDSFRFVFNNFSKTAVARIIRDHAEVAMHFIRNLIYPRKQEQVKEQQIVQEIKTMQKEIEQEVNNNGHGNTR